MFVNKFIKLSVFLISIALLYGCAQNSVRLVYPDTTKSATYVDNPTACIIQFTDIRSMQALGYRQDGSAFTPSSQVTDWFTHALTVELTNRGIAVIRVATVDDAAHSKAKYHISGSIDQIELAEHSSTSYSCTMRASVTIRQGDTPILNTSFNSNLSRSVIPLSNVPQEMMTETLNDLITTMANAIQKSIAH